MPAHVVRVEPEEAVDRAVELAAQAVLDPLAHHRALLARDGEHVRLLVGEDRLAEGHVELLPRPSRLAHDAVLELEMGYAEPLGELARRSVEERDRRRVSRRDAAVHAKRQRHERVAEEETLDLREGQNADEAPRALREQVIGAVTEAVRDDFLPARAMEERRLQAARDERVPAREIAVRREADLDTGGELGGEIGRAHV